MSFVRTSASLHKWLALVVGLPILAWFVSGLFIAFVPEDAIHGHHPPDPAPVDAAAVAQPLAQALAARPGSYAKVEARSMLGRPVALLTPVEGRPQLVDLTTGHTVSPIDRPTAIALALETMGAHTGLPVRAEQVSAPSRVYQGPLPAWRVVFADQSNTEVYVAANLGRVVASRGDLFRVYDTMWSFHILNFADPRGINTWWLWGLAALATVVAMTGFVMLPSRLRLKRRRRLNTERL
ncbi:MULTISPECIES: PepSY domain-containing protein [Sphingosinicellaceae]|uniref:PepSY domain-containing protein n=1 Tax=Sphingosinicellaceae TaxID=2820280 RepID=UPI001C1E3EA5|nr:MULTISPECIES: PepSY domain-containing protein [Polymorphobacter]QYE37023.1 PepSY domain-containing protein [Polymorphobacter sp. PAMC 29334]UAJ12979.1 PepSY domain-containing protein [Polymorphobacter megasporae]